MPSLSSLASGALLAALIGVAPGAAKAAPTIFFGADPMANGALVVGGNSQTARNQFAAGLLTSATENFESNAIVAGTQPTVTSPLGIFNGVGSLFRNENAPGVALIEDNMFLGGLATGRFNTSSAAPGKWFESSASFSITTSAMMSAFGFYGTDFGDFDGSVSIDLFDGATQVLSQLTVPSAGGNNGSLLFFGYLNSEIRFNRIVFNVNQLDPSDIDSYDVLGFDDFMTGLARNGTPPPGVPEPGTLALVALSLGLLAARRRKG